MPSTQNATFFLFWAQIVSATASAIYIGQWMLNQSKRLRNGNLSSLPISHPRLLLSFTFLSMLFGAGGLYLLSRKSATLHSAEAAAARGSQVTLPTTSTPVPSPVIPKKRMPLSNVPATRAMPNPIAQPLVGGSVKQGGDGGCQQNIVGGSNNTNNCGPTAFSFTSDQESKAAEIFKKTRDLTGSADIAYEWSAPDGAEAAQHMQELLTGVNIPTRIESCGMCVEYPGAPAFPGLSFGNVTGKNRELADAIESALKAGGVVHAPVKRDEMKVDGETFYI